MFQNRSHRITAYCDDAQFAAWAGGDLAQHRGRNGKVLGRVTGARLIHCGATGTGGYVDKGNLGAAFARAGRRRQLALMSMAFNLGAPRLGGFRRMRAAIQSGDWHQAAREALDSRWASQVGTRAGEIADMLCSTKPIP